MRERTVTFFDQVMTERITREALTVIAGLLFGIGWVAYKALAAIWFVLAWCAAAVKVGWREARAADRT
jgi:hypothetical protein